MTLSRSHDWPERLCAFIESRRHQSFSWGSNDCAMFWADAVAAMTGVDLAERWRGYTTEKKASTIVRRAGGMKSLALQAGAVEKKVGFAQRGDGVLVVLDGRETFGVVTGSGDWCAPGATGLVFRPLNSDQVLAAFEV